jgi:hypothetical protein
VVVSVSLTAIFNKPRSLTILVQFVWGGPGRYIQMWQLKREISRDCNDIIGSAKGSQISEKYWGEVGKGKRVDVYLWSKEEEGAYIFWMKQVPVGCSYADVVKYSCLHWHTSFMKSFLTIKTGPSQYRQFFWYTEKPA